MLSPVKPVFTSCTLTWVSCICS